MAHDALLFKSTKIQIGSEPKKETAPLQHPAILLDESVGTIEILGDKIYIGTYVNGVIETGIIIDKAAGSIQLKGIVNGAPTGGDVVLGIPTNPQVQIVPSS